MANWYSYRGDGDVLLPSNYVRMSVKPTCISGGNTICTIYLNETGFFPSSIELTVQQYIADAQGTLVSQPQGSGKRFVYVKQV